MAVFSLFESFIILVIGLFKEAYKCKTDNLYNSPTLTMKINMFAEGVITKILCDEAKRILKKDPIRSAMDKTIEELEQGKQNGWFELREIDRNQKEIFNNINIIEEATFIKKFIENGVPPEIASKLYNKFSMKFRENIKEAALKKPVIFYPYVIREFENIKTDNKELIKFLTGFALKNDVYLDRIIKHFENLEQMPNIPDIQSVLKKDETKEEEFFRNEPFWVDYKHGFIVERKEVDEIIKKLENNTIQLVLGAPASGKSIILKNAGFKLAKKNKHKVYLVELKKHPQDEIKLFFETIPKIDDANPIFIIDDAHLYLSDCERLIRNFRSNGKGNLIIGSRKTREITEEHPKEGAEYEFLSELSKTCIHVEAEDVTEEMVNTFLEKQYHFEEDKIKTISSNLDIYKNDLWFLSWALKAYNKEKESVDIDEIYEKVKSSIEKIKVGKEKEPINAEDVFLPLSIFYRFEIPIERYFLEEQLGIDAKIINQLIGLQEIVEIKETRMLSLHHSSIAELYFGAYLSKSFLGRRIKKKILNGKNENKDNLNFCSFYRYLATDPRNFIDVIIYLGSDLEDKKGGKTLIKNFIEEKEIKQSIINWIKKEEDIGKAGRGLSITAKIDDEFASYVVASIGIDGLYAKIGQDASANGAFLEGILNSGKAGQESGMKLLNNVVSKIDVEEDIEKIAWCVFHISSASKEAALKLVESIDINVLSSKINKEEAIEKVGWFVAAIIYVKEEVLNEIINRLNPKRREEIQEWIEAMNMVGQEVILPPF